MDKEEKCKKAYDLAYKYEAEIGSCPQCVLSAIFETLDICDKNTIQASDALAGGTSLSTEGTCGALAGGLLAISSVVGRSYEDFVSDRGNRAVFRYSKLLYDRFIEEYGSPVCKNVQKKIFGRSFYLLDINEYKQFEKAGAHVDKCPSVSGNVASWAAEIIIELRKSRK